MKSFRFHSTLLYVGLTISSISFGQNAATKDSNKIKKWFPQYDFNAATFQKPSIEFAPFARWWWPGNYVTKEELKREINLFADNNFGGVEIQPLNLFVPGSKEEREKIVSWDTPDYYENVKAVMEEARKRGLTVDMTDGSGWPPGGRGRPTGRHRADLRAARPHVRLGSSDRRCPGALERPRRCGHHPRSRGRCPPCS